MVCYRYGKIKRGNRDAGQWPVEMWNHGDGGSGGAVQ